METLLLKQNTEFPSAVELKPQAELHDDLRAVSFGYFGSRCDTASFQ